MAARSKNVPSRPAPSAPPGFSGLKNLLVPNGAARPSQKSRSSFYLDEKAKKKPPPRPPPPKVVPQYVHRSSSLERDPRVGQNYTSGFGASAVPLLLPPPGQVQSRPKINQDLQPLIDLFSSPPPSSSSSSPTLTHHSGSDGFSVNSFTLEEDFDPFSPRSLASKQKDSFNKLKEDSVLVQFKQPDSGLQRQYALLYSHQPETKKATVAPTPSAPPKLLKKPTVIRSGHPPVAAKPPSFVFANALGVTENVNKFVREPSPPEPAVPPPQPPDARAYFEDDAPPALPPRRPHSEEPFNSDEPHAIVLFDYEQSHPDDLGCQAGEVVYLVSKVNDDWYTCKKKHGGEEGMMPATFLDILHPLRVAEDRRRSTPSPKPPSGVAATALYDFQGELDGDLAFPEGASILVEARINDEWYFGSFLGKRGQFPSNFVTPITASLPQHEP